MKRNGINNKDNDTLTYFFDSLLIHYFCHY